MSDTVLRRQNNPQGTGRSFAGGTDRNASATIFGFEFQAYVAMLLFLYFVRDLASLRLEGAHEDVELTFERGKRLYAQAKASVQPQKSSKARSKALEALKTLACAAGNPDCIKIVYATNMEMPFGKRLPTGCPPNGKIVPLKALPEGIGRFVQNALKTRSAPPHAADQFALLTFRFEGDGDARYETIDTAIMSFLETLGIAENTNAGELRTVWFALIFGNGTQHNLDTQLAKKDLVMPIAVQVCECCTLPPTLVSDLEWSTYGDPTRQMKSLIDRRVSDFSVTTQVIFDFDLFCQSSGLDIDALSTKIDFIRTSWSDYIEPFGLNSQPPSEARALAYTILFRILVKQKEICRIKEVTGTC